VNKKVTKIGWIVLAALLCLSLILVPGCTTPAEQEEEEEEPLPSLYIGSGKLDGEGIPVDFFSDVNVRIAFCYAFDYDTYIADALQGNGVQRGSPVVEGLYGYWEDTPMYSYDLVKAERYMKLAWDGEAWEKGFKFTLLYNAGNLPRKTACELVSEAWAGIGADQGTPEKYQISVQALAWPTILGKIFGTRDMPMFQIGWLPDYPHADNFIFPFMHTSGAFSRWQGYGDAELDAAIQEALLETDYETQMDMYEALQQRYYDDAPGIVLAQPIIRKYFTQHIDGFIYNPCESSYAGRLIDMSKSNNGGTIPYKNDDIFVFETIGDIYSLDPAWVYDTASGMQTGMINEQLLYYDGGSTEDFIGLLATDWSFNEATLEWRFTIRENVKFSNGNDLTPEDVEYTFERAMCQDRPGGPIWMFYYPLMNAGEYEDVTWADIDASVEVDGQDVVFTVCDAAWQLPFLQILCGQWAGIVDKEYCIANGDWDGTEADIPRVLHPANPGDIGEGTTGGRYLYDHPIGTGPWKLNTWDQSVEIILDKNPNYWGGQVPFNQVITKVVDEWASRKLSLLAGDADLVTVPASRYDEMDPEVPDLQVFFNLPSLQIDAFFFNYIIGGPAE
jgi:ABC-type transport system substrate-binding protein